MIIEGYKEKWKSQVAYLRTFDENIAEDFIWKMMYDGFYVVSADDKTTTYYNADYYNGTTLSLDECIEKTENVLIEHKTIYHGFVKED